MRLERGRQQRVEGLDRLGDPDEVVGDVAEERTGVAVDAGDGAGGEPRIGSRSGSTARRTSASSRLRM